MRKFLHINLDDRSVETEELEGEAVVRAGRYLIAKTLVEKGLGKVDPLSPENPLIFSAGPFAGSNFSNANRLSVGCKSPLTHAIKEANVGGQPAQHLAKLGYRGVIVKGKPADASKRWGLEIDAEGARLVEADDTAFLRNYALCAKLGERYDKNVEVIFPDPNEIQKMVSKNGMNLFYESLENRKLCCRIRKVEPMRRYLKDLDAYVTGLRRDQNVTRTDTPKLQVDYANRKILKINPIADWTHDDVWQYVRRHDLPVNRLHGEGFPSVGCGPCTRAVKPGDDPRSGRWWWENEDTRECGLHVNEQDDGSGI